MTAGGFAGDALDFGGGVHNLLVEDVFLKDYLRQGLDFAGGLSGGDRPSRNFTARRVRDLAFTPGVINVFTQAIPTILLFGVFQQGCF